jgi:hypothetical protein
LAFQFKWGNFRQDRMEAVILSLPVLDISVPEILDRYVEIDCYGKGKHPTLDSEFSASSTSTVFSLGMNSFARLEFVINKVFINFDSWLFSNRIFILDDVISSSA